MSSKFGGKSISKRVCGVGVGVIIPVVKDYSGFGVLFSPSPVFRISQQKVVMKMARRLKTYSDCRRFLAWVVNEVLSNRMESGKASKLNYVVSGIVKIIETRDLDRIKADIQELEDQMEEGVYE